jgi:hypothetical protein
MMTGYQSKKTAAQDKLDDDDDTQVYQRPWVGLTDNEKTTAIWTDGGFGAGALWAEAKLKERNS